MDENGKAKLDIAVPWKISLDRISVDLYNERKSLRLSIRPVNQKHIQLIWGISVQLFDFDAHISNIHGVGRPARERVNWIF